MEVQSVWDQLLQRCLSLMMSANVRRDHLSVLKHHNMFLSQSEEEQGVDPRSSEVSTVSQSDPSSPTCFSSAQSPAQSLLIGLLLSFTSCDV